MPRHIRSGIFLAGAVVLGFAAIRMSFSGSLRMAQEQETLPGPEQEMITSAAVPPAPILGVLGPTSVNLRIDVGDNSSGTEYAVYSSTMDKWVDPVAKTITSASAVWAADTGAWDIAAGGIIIQELSPKTAYAFAAKARNMSLAETALGAGAEITTPAAGAVNTNANENANENENENVNENVNTPPVNQNHNTNTAPPPVNENLNANLNENTNGPSLAGNANGNANENNNAPPGNMFGNGQPPYEPTYAPDLQPTPGTGGGAAPRIEPPRITDVRLVGLSKNAIDANLRDVVLEIHGSGDPATGLLVFTFSSTPRTQAFKIAISPWVVTWPIAGVEAGTHTLSAFGASDAGWTSAESDPLGFDIPATVIEDNSSLVGVALPACSDGIDNDNDGLTDYPNDPDCSSPNDSNEQGATIGIVQRALEPFLNVEKTATVMAVRTVVDNPGIETVSRRAVVPVATTAAVVATVAATGPSILIYLQYLLTLPLGLLLRRRRERWGLVYNSLTKKPMELALIRLIDAKTGRIIQTRVTDKGGRFLFLVKPGSYQLLVQKSGIVFPSSILKSIATDGRFAEIYHGETITVGGQGVSVIGPNVPVDPADVPASSLRALAFGRSLREFGAYMPLIGLVGGAASLVIVPTGLLFALFLGNVLVYLLARRLLGRKKPHSYGLVFDAHNKKPIRNAIVRLFDASYHKQLETQLTDNRGRYAFLVGPNIYEVGAQAAGYEVGIERDIDLRGKETAIVDVKIGLQRAAASPGVIKPMPTALPDPKDCSVPDGQQLNNGK